MARDSDFWRGRRVLVTGHSGFKGAWLSLWLAALGAEVTGVSPGVPTAPSLYELARVGELVEEVDADVRDAVALKDAVARSRAEVIVHLAAQPLVRRGHADPLLTYDVYVMGTVNLLEAARHAGMARAVLVVTSDKCYANPPGIRRRFVEGDALGGDDPYAASKACAEVVTAAYRQSLRGEEGGPRIASARAGNVIGGGDWGADRIVPDAVRAVEARRELRVRSPAAVRPWQHVLSALGGYLAICERLAAGDPVDRAWNIGPPEQDERTVGWVVERLAGLWEGELRWSVDGDGGEAREAAHLALDSSAAERELGWRPVCSLDDALALVVEWHRSQRRGADARALTLAQIERVT
jgi:CDP-glucose 4,6-dehydratase